MSRIYVSNLPPSINDADFVKHFKQGPQCQAITDIRLIPQRRIGFIGFKRREDAEAAVKYFNKTFLRLSRISVEMAKPIDSSHLASKSVGISELEASSETVQGKEVKMVEVDSKKRKRDVLDESDSKLQEFLEVKLGSSAKKLKDDDKGESYPGQTSPADANPSEDEYEELPSRSLGDSAAQVTADEFNDPDEADEADSAQCTRPQTEICRLAAAADDENWLRSRTSRVLDLLDPDDPFPPRSRGNAASKEAQGRVTTPAVESRVETGEPRKAAKPARGDSVKTATAESNQDEAVKLIQSTARVLCRNLPFATTAADVQELFGGEIVEEVIHVEKRGLAFVKFHTAEAAIRAYIDLDGTAFQGRIIHVLPANAKRESKLDETSMAKLPLKKQREIKKKAQAASSAWTWNSLFMSQDAVNSAVADRLGISKAEMLDPHSADAAVRQAHAETTVIQEAKSYFESEGLNLEAFKSPHREDRAILVKNIRSSAAEIRRLFEEHGTVLRVLVPPSGTIAVVEFAEPSVCRAAFAARAYSRLNDAVLFLEKGPAGLFRRNASDPDGTVEPPMPQRPEQDDVASVDTQSIYLKGLDFSTSNEKLRTTFEGLDGFMSAVVKTKKDLKKPGQLLSLGYGFLVFRTKEYARQALKSVDGYRLDGKVLSAKLSHQGLDVAEERKREDLEKAKGSKLIIKNLPFQVSRKEVRQLFSRYGTLKVVRLPKKVNHSSRGFGFCEFASAKDASMAMQGLSNTHLLGRRLVLEWAEDDAVSAEEQIRKMEKKTRSQMNKVALQQLTGRGRTKVNMGTEVEGEE